MPKKISATESITAGAPVRERLLDTADRLFYREGVRAVGIDRVLAEAGAAKASLYAHFGSKDDLVAAHVERRAAAARGQIEAWQLKVAPAERALRFFDWVVEWTRTEGYRGCPLQHIVAEVCDPQHPARTIVAAQRAWMQGKFLEWSKAARVADPRAVAGALYVLFDGAVVASEHDGVRRAREARWAAERLLAG